MTVHNKGINVMDHFEDDPVKEIRRIRDEITGQFRSHKDYIKYLASVPSATELLDEIKQKKSEATVMSVKSNVKTPPPKTKKRDEKKTKGGNLAKPSIVHS